MRKILSIHVATLNMLFSSISGAAVSDAINNLEPVMTFDHTAKLLSTQLSLPDETITASRDTVADMPFSQCLTLDVKKPGASPYALNLQFFETNRWNVGDTGLISFYCRTLETENRFGASSLKLQYKPNYDDWRGHLETELFLTKDWKRVTLPFKVKIDAATTPQTVLNYFLGGVDPHKFQLAELRVYNFGKDAPLENLPRSKAYYPGMEPGAAWRKAADTRIEKYRKADLQLRILDSKNRPIRNAGVHIKLKRHRFGFGAAVHSPLLVSPEVPPTDRNRYSEILTRTCSKVTPTNAMKWRLYSHFKTYVPDLISWCEKYDMTLRGHLFIWPGFERLPEGYNLYKTDPEAFRKDLTDHIHEFATMHPDAFSEWDVMNEPYTEHDYMDLLGKDVVLDWFNTARQANPNYLTYINDYGILSGNNQEHRDNYYDWIDWLIENDAPLDGIGFQGHYRTAIPPELILERINRYASFGKKMQITEFDFKHTDTELQARFFEDFVTLIYSHPQMSALINWIFLEDDFRPTAALYRKDFTPTAMGRVWEHLLTKQWHTEAQRVTDHNGTIKLRGFKGIYSIEIEHDKQMHCHELKLESDGQQTLTIE